MCDHFDYTGLRDSPGDVTRAGGRACLGAGGYNACARALSGARARYFSKSEPDPPLVTGPCIYIPPYSREKKILEYISGRTSVTPQEAPECSM